MKNREGSDNAHDAEHRMDAALWVMRLDRGLSAEEQDAFFEWLAEDPSHGEDLRRRRSDWDRLNKLAAWRPEHGKRPNPDLLAPPPSRAKRRWVWFAAPLAAAAALVIAGVWIGFAPEQNSASASPVASDLPLGHMALADGSLVQLNEDAVVKSEYSASERRVRLESGEAFFMVEKDPYRPFVVEAAGLDVSAVGTSFNVRLGEEAVEVLVAAGQVRVGSTSRPGSTPSEETAALHGQPSLLELRQRAVIPLHSKRLAEPPRIDTLTSSEIRRVLSWQHCMLDFTEATLSDVAGEFNRRNAEKIVIAEPELAAERISGTFRSENVAAFARLVEAGFGAEAVRRDDEVIELRLRR